MNVYKQCLEIKPLQEISIPVSSETDIVRLEISDGKPCVGLLEPAGQTEHMHHM